MSQEDEGPEAKRQKLSQVSSLEDKLQEQIRLVAILECEKRALREQVEDLRKAQVRKSDIHSFLESILQIELSDDVLVDITLNEVAGSMIVVGRPPVMGSASKQMRHVTPYSFVKCMIEYEVAVAQHIQNLLPRLQEVVISLVSPDCGIALRKPDYDKLGLDKIYNIHLTTSKNEYYFIDDPMLDYKSIFNVLGFSGEDKVKSAHNKAHVLYLRKKKKFLEFAMQNLYEALTDDNTVGIACEALARFIFTLFNQKPYTAFPEEGNSLNYEIRLYANQQEANSPIGKGYSILASNDVREKIRAGEDLNGRIRIVDCEGSMVKKSIEGLKLLGVIIGKQNNGIDYAQEIAAYNAKNLPLCLSSDNPIIQAKKHLILSCNANIDLSLDIASQLSYHIAKLLYFVFDFKPLEDYVFVPKTSKELLDASLTNIKVFPSASGTKQANYTIKLGQEYRDDQKNGAKGYNKDVAFRVEATDIELLAKKVVDHVFIVIKSFSNLKDGIIGNIECSPLSFLRDFATITAYDYRIDPGEFFAREIEVARRKIIDNLFRDEHHRGNTSESDIVGASKPAGDASQAMREFDIYT